MLAPFLYRKEDRQLCAQWDRLVINFSSIITDLKYSSRFARAACTARTAFSSDPLCMEQLGNLMQPV